MPDDDSPVSSAVTETTTIDTGADKETTESINSAFDDFWKQEDEKTEGAPSAPGDGAAQETKEPMRDPKPDKPETKEREPETSPPETKEYTDEEIDRLALTHENNRPAAIEGFKQLKSGWKAERAKAIAASERADKAERELAEARQNSWTPETKADYEHALSVRRKFDFLSDPEFQARFHNPITQKYQELLNETVGYLPDKKLALEWAQEVAGRFKPDDPEVGKNWWNHDVLAKVPNEIDRESLRQGVANLFRMQRERDEEIHRRTNDKSAYDNWEKERKELQEKHDRQEIIAEIAIQEQKLKEIFKKDVAGAKTKEEREAIEAHNERYDRLNADFQQILIDLTKNGARAMVRAAIESTRGKYIESEYTKLEKEFKAAKAERDQLRSELDKIQGSRRKISHTTGTPPAGSSKEKNGQGLTLKGLDVRESFKDFDWKDGS